MTPRDALASIPFFGRTLSSTELESLAEKLQVSTFPRGAMLMRQGDIGASMFVILDGKVAVAIHSRQGEKRVATLGARDIVGEMSLFTGARRSATVTTLRQVTAIEITKPAVERLLIDSTGLVERLAAMVEQRHAELDHLHREDERWYSGSVSHHELVARMTAFYNAH